MQGLFFDFPEERGLVVERVGDDYVEENVRNYIPYKIKIKPNYEVIGSQNPEFYIRYFNEILNEYKIGCVVNLMEPKEETKTNAMRICKENNVRYVNLPVKDQKSPNPEQVEFVKQLIIEFNEIGKNVMIHCLMGRGRTITMIKLVGILFGENVDIYNQINDVFHYDGNEYLEARYGPCISMAQDLVILEALENKFGSDKIKLEGTKMYREIPKLIGGGYYKKYLKYKFKYLKLKKNF